MSGWQHVEVGPRQLQHLCWLCRYHLRTGHNEKAMEMTRRLLRRLEKAQESGQVEAPPSDATMPSSSPGSAPVAPSPTQDADIR